jgi:lipid II:glycine glycyltransferase (peptidoglycan interpeptide bridge formation enzyme)
VENSRDIDTFEQLYRMTFARQGVFHEEELNLLVRSITTTAIQEGFGDLLICRNRDGQAISATLFLFDEKCGYYMFGANHPEHNKANGGTLLLLENIRCCQSRSLEFVDVMGINSPNRGDFKTSFNAVPVPYFVVTWERP